MKPLTLKHKEGVICGVCSGLSDYFAMDVSIVRILFILLALGTNFPIVITYLILAVLMPDEIKNEEQNTTENNEKV